MKLNVRVTAIIFYERKLVVVKHENPKQGIYYLLPGGGLEHAEGIEECVIREVKEEVGLNIKIDHLSHYKSVYTNDEDTLDLIFKCEIIGGELKNSDPDGKVKSIKLIKTEEDLMRLNFHPKQLKKLIFKDKLAISLGKAQFPE